MAKRPNVLLFLVDELRYPTVYDGPVLREWMQANLRAQRVLRENGVDFSRHYVQSAACAPSRTSIFTGQYPSLHGVTQTDGIGKQIWDPGMYWLDPDMVPTMGDYFRAAGYRTHYRGKWHISHEDIEIPGTHNSLLSNTTDGTPIVENTTLYRRANRLDKFGFDGWIGPEPHGSNQANCGWTRDPLYCQEALGLLDRLDSDPESSDEPWLIVNSYVNPHDIVFFGLIWKSWGLPYPTDADVPPIPPPPTQNEDLSTKPRAQQSYVDTYGQMFFPQPQVDLYRQFYYYLQVEAENHVTAVYERLLRSRFADDTIVVFTSDHGEMLGAHGGMHQKWYQAYEETIHVPLIITGKPVTESARSIDALTSHADLLPTILGLAGIDSDEAAREVAKTHGETRRLVGRDLSRAVRGEGHIAPEPVYFMTVDDVAQGLSQITGQRQWRNVHAPNQVEAIVVELDGVLWKYVHYNQEVPAYPNITNPNINQIQQIYAGVPDQYEQYKLSEDQLEVHNLAWPGKETPESVAVRPRLEAILAEQRELKRLTPVFNQGNLRSDGEGATINSAMPGGMEHPEPRMPITQPRV